MLGLEWERSALTIGPGTELRLTGRTLSPPREAQAAAGTANSAFSPDTASTSGDALPRTAEKKRSIAAARSYWSEPGMTAVRKPEGRAVLSPTRITCASFERSEPLGFSRPSVSL